jgi:hypothetical protein
MMLTLFVSSFLPSNSTVQVFQAQPTMVRLDWLDKIAKAQGEKEREVKKDERLLASLSR